MTVPLDVVNDMRSMDAGGVPRAEIDAEVGEPASRDLGGIEAPCLLLDATYVKCGSRVRPTAVVTAIGVGSDGVRRMLGIAATGTETRAGRLGFLRGLRERGLDGVRLVVGDARACLVRAVVFGNV